MNFGYFKPNKIQLQHLRNLEMAKQRGIIKMPAVVTNRGKLSRSLTSVHLKLDDNLISDKWEVENQMQYFTE
jgi:hypothetical protein